jgi:hypothetical protein
MSKPQSLTSRCIALEDTRNQSNQSNQSNQANPAFEDDSDPFVVNGVALGEGNVTVGASQTATYWPPPVLREAAPKLEGVPIVANNSADSHDPGSQPPVRDIVGEVTDAAYADGVGIIYQGEVDDREIARKIDRGRVDVSPVMARDLGDYSETHDARVAESITEFRDLGIVFEGASADASIETGPNASAAVLGGHALAGEALAAAFGTTDPAAVAEALAESDALASIGDLSEGTIVRWEASGGTAYGRVRRTIESEDASFDSEIDGDVTVSGPAALITVYRPGDDGYEATDQQVAHKPDTLTVIDSFPATDANAASHAQRGDERAEPDDERSDTRAGGDDSGSDTIPESDMTMDLTDDEEALIHAARSTETPTVVDAEDEALARQATDLRIDQFDDPTVVETATYDALEARVESVEDALADALADQTGISESAAHSLDLDALVAEFEDDEGNLDAEALVQSPETGGAGDADDPRDDPGGSPGDLDAEDRETVRDNLRRAELLESRTPDHAEALRSEAAALVGVEQAEDIDMEAL